MNPPKGWDNVGQSCYASAALQCMCNSKFLVDWARNRKKPDAISRILTNDERDPRPLLKTLWTTATFMPFQQHDSHEFLLRLLDVTHSSLSKQFCIHTRRQCKCSSCGRKGDVIKEEVVTLPVAAGEGMNEAIAREISATKNLDDEWKCEHCHAKGHGLQATRVVREPNVLVVLRLDVGRRTAIQSVVALRTKRRMRITGIVRHEGNHYTAVVRNGDTWFLCDDETVTECRGVLKDDGNVASAVADRAYMIWYE